MSNSQLIFRSIKRGALAGCALAFLYTLFFAVAMSLLHWFTSKEAGDWSSFQIALVVIIFGVMIGIVPAILLGALTGFITAKIVTSNPKGNSLTHGSQGLLATLIPLALFALFRIIAGTFPPTNSLESLWIVAVPIYLGASFWMGRRVHHDLLQTPA